MDGGPGAQVARLAGTMSFKKENELVRPRDECEREYPSVKSPNQYTSAAVLEVYDRREPGSKGPDIRHALSELQNEASREMDIAADTGFRSGSSHHTDKPQTRGIGEACSGAWSDEAA